MLFVKTQPVAGLHESVVQAFASLQTTAVPMHVPPLHASPLVQAFPSSQPFVLFVKTQPVDGLHESVVQAFASLQTTEVPVHAPPLQTSPLVQALLSSQAFVLFVKTQPVAGLQLSVVHALPSLHTSVRPAWHVPPPQVSPVVHALPSSQAFALLVKTQPVAGLQLSVVQRLLSLQTTAEPAWHVPPPQTSPVVQAFPSSQAFALLVKTQPVASVQVSVVHGLLSLQMRPTPGWQVPPPQVSPVVQGLPSSQANVLFVKTQPVAGLHVSVVQTLASSQTTAVPAKQVPPPQVSPVVQAFPSSHAFALFVKTHPVAGLQLSVVQTLASSQTIAAPPQTPPLQMSPDVHAFPSSQAAVLFVNTQPAAGSHVSVVHTLPSLQMTADPAWQVPPPQASPVVQASPSSQAFVLFAKTQPEAGLHESVVQLLLSLQTTAEPAWHVPPPQTSPVVQAFPSSHAFVLLVKTQPVASVQVSVVQGLLSLQMRPAPG